MGMAIGEMGRFPLFIFALALDVGNYGVKGEGGVIVVRGGGGEIGAEFEAEAAVVRGFVGGVGDEE